MTSLAVISPVDQERGRVQPYLVAFAALAVVALGANLDLRVAHLTTALVVGGALAPVTLTAVLRGSRWLTWLTCVSAVAIVYGLWLSMRPGGRPVVLSDQIGDISHLLALVLGAALVFWARGYIADHWVAVLYGVGLLMRLVQAGGLFSENAWKYGFALPVTVICLGLAWAWHSQKLTFCLLAVLALAAAVNDSRSAFALAALTALLLLWARRPRQRVDGRWLGSLVLLIVAFFGMYKLAEAAIVQGYLGQETQARTERQLQTSNSLFLGSRPEIGATLALMKQNPAGFGPGVQPTPADIETAKNGMADLGHPPDEGYVEGYMLGAGFELHSTTGDLWAHFGWVGLVLAASILVFALRGIAQEVASAWPRALLILLGLQVLRDVVASPIGTSVLVWMLFLGLMAARGPGLQPRSEGTPTSRDHPAEATVR